MQDDASKRVLPTEQASTDAGQDVLVPWVLSSTPSTGEKEGADRVLNRYYHMFAQGELANLVRQAAQEMGLEVGRREDFEAGATGLEIVRDDWERSNYYVELHRWTNETV